MATKILFYVFAAILIYAAIRVVVTKNPVVAVLHLVLAFVSSSALWMLIQAEFLALTLVVVYVGAVMVLFLFVVMMLDFEQDVLREGFVRYFPIGLMVGGLMALQLVLVLVNKEGIFGQVSFPDNLSVTSNTRALGILLYTEYLYPFLVVAVILLLAMVAAISLVHRPVRKNNKSIDVSLQLETQKSNCIRIVSMPSESPEALPHDENEAVKDGAQ